MNKKIRIMHLSTAGRAVGGPDKTILLSAEKIDRDLFEPTIVYMMNIYDDASIIEQRAKNKNLISYIITERSKVDWQAIRKLKNLLEEHRVDILHSHGYKADCLGLLLSKLYKVKLITTTHGWASSNPKMRFYYWIDKIVIRYYDKVIAVSEAMRRELLAIGISPQKLVAIHNAIDTEDFKKSGSSDIRRQLNLNEQTPLVGTISRLSKEKNLETLLFAAKEVISKEKEVRFLIVGEGPERINLESLANKLKIKDNIILLGHREDIKKIYETINLLVSTSATEGLPNTILEALSMGVPVVATKVGGVGEIIKDGVNGLLFQPGDVVGIAGGIMRILSDSVLASNFTQKGRELICNNFLFDARMKKIERLYLEVMGLQDKVTVKMNEIAFDKCHSCLDNTKTE